MTWETGNSFLQEKPVNDNQADAYADLADSQDSEDRAYHAAMRARRRDPERTLTARQLSALASRAMRPTMAPGQFGQAITDATTKLAEILAGPPAELIGKLREFVRAAPKWDNNEYLDGWACVADDVHGVLDGDRDVIKMLCDSRPVPAAQSGGEQATTILLPGTLHRFVAKIRTDLAEDDATDRPEWLYQLADLVEEIAEEQADPFNVTMTIRNSDGNVTGEDVTYPREEIWTRAERVALAYLGEPAVETESATTTLEES